MTYLLNNASPGISSTLGNLEVSGSGTYAPTLSITSGDTGTWSTAAEDIDTGSSVTVTDPTTTTPSFAYPAIGKGTIATHTFTNSRGLTQKLTYAVIYPQAGGATWTTTKDLDFTSDVTNIASITFGGGDTTLYEADGTTEKATIRGDVRLGGPTKSANVTSGTGFQLLSHGATDGSDIAVKFVDGGANAWEDPGVTLSDENPVSIDIIMSGLNYNVANTDNITAVLSDNFLIVGGSTNETRGGYLVRTGSGDFEVNGRRVVGGSSQLGTPTDSNATQSTTCVFRIIIWKGCYADFYWERGTTTPLEGIPTVAGNVKKMVIGTENIAIEGTLPMPNNFYVALEAFSSGASSTDRTVVLERIRIQELA